MGYKTYFPIAKSTHYKRLWPLGDSLTWGFPYAETSEFTYRAHLKRLRPDLLHVGTLPSAHDGHGGLRTDELAEQVPVWLARIDRPDIVLVHAGTNDVLQNTGFELPHLVSVVHEHLPTAKILVARISQWNPESGRVSQFNLEQVDNLTAVKVVDFENVLTPDQYWLDGLHPNEAGYEYMANIWVNALAEDGD